MLNFERKSKQPICAMREFQGFGDRVGGVPLSMRSGTAAPEELPAAGRSSLSVCATRGESVWLFGGLAPGGAGRSLRSCRRAGWCRFGLSLDAEVERVAQCLLSGVVAQVVAEAVWGVGEAESEVWVGERE
jgi:hypothetical protein